MMGWQLPTEGAKTLNGAILEQLETIPAEGTHLLLDDYAIEILETSDNGIISVRINSDARAAPREAAVE